MNTGQVRVKTTAITNAGTRYQALTRPPGLAFGLGLLASRRCFLTRVWVFQCPPATVLQRCLHVAVVPLVPPVGPPVGREVSCLRPLWSCLLLLRLVEFATPPPVRSLDLTGCRVRELHVPLGPASILHQRVRDDPLSAAITATSGPIAAATPTGSAASASAVTITTTTTTTAGSGTIQCGCAVRELNGYIHREEW